MTDVIEVIDKSTTTEEKFLPYLLIPERTNRQKLVKTQKSQTSLSHLT